MEFFEPILKEGKDILHFTLSGGISGSVNSANIAKTQMEEKYPERKIVVIDSLAASSGFGMLVDAALDKQEEGLSPGRKCRMGRKRIRISFITGSLLGI